MTNKKFEFLPFLEWARTEAWVGSRIPCWAARTASRTSGEASGAARGRRGPREDLRDGVRRAIEGKDLCREDGGGENLREEEELTTPRPRCRWRTEDDRRSFRRPDPCASYSGRACTSCRRSRCPSVRAFACESTADRWSVARSRSCRGCSECGWRSWRSGSRRIRTRRSSWTSWSRPCSAARPSCGSSCASPCRPCSWRWSCSRRGCSESGSSSDRGRGSRMCCNLPDPGTCWRIKNSLISNCWTNSKDCWNISLSLLLFNYLKTRPIMFFCA